MKKVLNFYVNSSLILRIAIGIVIGIVLGLWVPQAGFVAVFGDIFSHFFTIDPLCPLSPLLLICSMADAFFGSKAIAGLQNICIFALIIPIVEN